VIIVEGATDKAVLPLLAKQINIFKYDYSFIEAGGKEDITRYIHLFNCFKIRYVVVYDKDHHGWKSPKDITRADEISQLIEDKIDATLGSSVVLDNDIEEELGVPIHGRPKPFAAVKQIATPGYAMPAQLEQKLRLIYA
jgi:predicted ATP-dependent endonuclease of OLD family